MIIRDGTPSVRHPTNDSRTPSLPNPNILMRVALLASAEGTFRLTQNTSSQHKITMTAWCRFLRRPARRLSDPRPCLASEKRSSGKSRGWAWWDGRGLWGFDEEDCFGSACAGRGLVAHGGKFGLRFAVFRPICVVFHGARRFSRCWFLDLRGRAGPQAV